MVNCMESNLSGQEASTAAQASLDALLADRQKLASRAQAPAWYYPAAAVATAAIVGARAIPDAVWMFALIGLACAAIAFLELGYRRATGLSTNRIPGPLSLLVLIGMGVTVVAMLTVTGWLAASGQQSWVVVTVSISFLTMYPGGLLYDRVYGLELSRGI